MRAHANEVLRNEAGKPMEIEKDRYFTGEMFGEYVEWREKNPSDDLITELLNVEFEDETGTTRKLTKQELIVFLAVVAGAGVETTGRLFGWMGKVLAEHPDQRKELAQDQSSNPDGDRGAPSLSSRPARTWPAISPRTTSLSRGRSCPRAARCC